MLPRLALSVAFGSVSRPPKPRAATTCRQQHPPSRSDHQAKANPAMPGSNPKFHPAASRVIAAKHVMPEAQSRLLGSIRQGIPLRRTKIMLARPARSVRRGRPPRGLTNGRRISFIYYLSFHLSPKVLCSRARTAVRINGSGLQGRDGQLRGEARNCLADYSSGFDTNRFVPTLGPELVDESVLYAADNACQAAEQTF